MEWETEPTSDRDKVIWLEHVRTVQTARIAELEAENERLRERAQSAERLVRPAADYNGVPDSEQSPEWNAGYRQRQREEWSRALCSEERARQAAAQRDRLAELLREVDTHVLRPTWSKAHAHAKLRITAALAELEEKRR